MYLCSRADPARGDGRAHRGDRHRARACDGRCAEGWTRRPGTRDERGSHGVSCCSRSHFGARKHAMGAIMNGIMPHSGYRVFGGTYSPSGLHARRGPAGRTHAASGHVRVDARLIGLGEDGPTHQPIEHYAALRAIPAWTLSARPTPTRPRWRGAPSSSTTTARPGSRCPGRTCRLRPHGVRVGRGCRQGRVRAAEASGGTRPDRRPGPLRAERGLHRAVRASPHRRCGRCCGAGEPCRRPGAALARPVRTAPESCAPPPAIADRTWRLQAQAHSDASQIRP